MTDPIQQEEPGLKLLKVGVIGMGVFLIFGGLALIAAIAIKSTVKAKLPTTAKVASSQSVPCSEKPLDLPIMGTINYSVTEDGILTIGSSKQTYVVDVCSGKILVNARSLSQ